MQRNNNFVATGAWISRATLLALLASLMAACNNQTPANPDVVVVSPTSQPSTSTTTAVSPTPQPSATTTIVVVSPTPQPSATSTIVVSPTPAASPTPNTVVIKEPITDVVVISSAPDAATLVNKRVKFTNVQVESVVGDRTFWVGRSNNERLFVVLAPRLDKGKTDEKVVIKKGQTLDLTGVLKPMPSVEQAQKQWTDARKKLNAKEIQVVKSQAIYLQTDTIKSKL